MWKSHAAPIHFVWIAGAIWISAGTAWAAPASHSWYVTAAPGNVLALSDSTMQPPGGIPAGDDEGDSTDVPLPRNRFKEPETPAPTDTLPPPRIKSPTWAFPDSTMRSDSMTVSPNSTGSAAGGSGTNPPGKVRRGVFGIHPIALLVGMVALHVFIVGVATK